MADTPRSERDAPCAHGGSTPPPGTHRPVMESGIQPRTKRWSPLGREDSNPFGSTKPGWMEWQTRRAQNAVRLTSACGFESRPWHRNPPTPRPGPGQREATQPGLPGGDGVSPGRTPRERGARRRTAPPGRWLAGHPGHPGHPPLPAPRMAPGAGQGGPRRTPGPAGAPVRGGPDQARTRRSPTRARPRARPPSRGPWRPWAPAHGGRRRGASSGRRVPRTARRDPGAGVFGNPRALTRITYARQEPPPEQDP